MKTLYAEIDLHSNNRNNRDVHKIIKLYRTKLTI